MRHRRNYRKSVYLKVESPRGTNGFGYGYDPLFEAEEAGWRTTAELPPDEKNRLSHRGRAFAAMLPTIDALLGRSE